jgi:hypothetical protein
LKLLGLDAESVGHVVIHDAHEQKLRGALHCP